MNKQPRRLKLVRPGLQLRLILVFAGMCALSLTVQYILFTSILASVATTLPHDGLILLDGAMDLLVAGFMASFGILLPLTFVIGVLTTHRFAGPIYRFEAFLREVREGRTSEACVLRKGDELGELCELINEATAERRARNESDEQAPATAPAGVATEAA